jgi:serine/threonine protein kinase
VSPARHHHALPAGYRLHWYEIDTVLGQGGFGITYLAQDENLDQLVAIKEFLPTDLATRTRDSDVHPLSDGHTDTYGWGLNRFLTEARTLAKFRHPNIVRVLSVFEANNTAYMVMEYERGESLESALRGHRIAGEETLKGIVLALLNGLALVHDAGFIHRDIKPSNIYLREDGIPVLLDFGSARLALGVETRTLTSLVSPGYAPFEQYNTTRDSDKQGPWTDIYALGATMYRAITGQGPVDAAARANLLLDENRDPFQPCAQLAEGKCSAPFLHAIDRALAFKPAHRPQSVQAWRVLLEADQVDPDAATALAVDQDDETMVRGSVDFPVGEGDTRPDTDGSTRPVTQTVPLTQPGAEEPITRAPANSSRRWFVATVIVVVLGVAATALLTRMDPSAENDAGVVSAPVTDPAATPVPRQAVASAVPTPPATSTTMAPSVPVQPPDTVVAKADAAPTVPATDIAAVREAPSAPPAPPAAAPEIPPTPVETTNVAAAPTRLPTPPASEKIEKKSDPPPVVAKAAPAPPKTTKKSDNARNKRKPMTRKEKVEQLLAQGNADLHAGRLTTPRKRNALYRYLTVVAMEPDNEAARRGVEKVVEKHLAAARVAANAGKTDLARKHLKQSRFVLEAMKLRKWPKDTLSFFYGELRELRQLLAKGG